jgi:hypothetical protein
MTRESHNIYYTNTGWNEKREYAHIHTQPYTPIYTYSSYTYIHNNPNNTHAYTHTALYVRMRALPGRRHGDEASIRRHQQGPVEHAAGGGETPQGLLAAAGVQARDENET